MIVRLDHFCRCIPMHLCLGVLVVVLRHLPSGMDVFVGMFMRVGMGVLVRMHHPPVRVLVSVSVGVLVNMLCFVRILAFHRGLLLERGTWDMTAILIDLPGDAN
jgi:hypothetical protein